MKNRFWKILGLVVVLSITGGAAWFIRAVEDTRPTEGLRENPPSVHALTGAQVVVSPGDILEDATIIIRDGRIENVGQKIDVPSDARRWDLSGATVYPGFIESYSHLGAADFPSSEKDAQKLHWNLDVRPERNVLDAYEWDEKGVSSIRELGFTAINLVPRNGVVRGEGALVHALTPGEPGVVIRRSTGQHAAFEFSRGTYPASLMGCIALMRQTFADARWYRRQQNQRQRQEVAPFVEDNRSLASLSRVLSGADRIFFQTGDELDFNRMLKLATEFRLNPVIVGNGYEYRQIEHLRGLVNPLVIPLPFPEAPAVDDPARALDVSLENLQHWEFAPENPAHLERADIPFAITAFGSKENEFWPRLRKAIERGLSEDVALAALTEIPAQLLGVGDELGRIEVGRIANLTVTRGNPFTDEKVRFVQTWVLGEVHEGKVSHEKDPTGSWKLTWHGVEGPENWTFTGSASNLTLRFGEGEPDPETKASMEGGKLILRLPGSAFGVEDPVRLSALVEDASLMGNGSLSDGTLFNWSAERTAGGETPSEPAEEKESPELLQFAQYPAGAFPGLPKGEGMRPDGLLIRNATLWTSGPQGVIEGADMLVEEGKITSIGHGLAAPEGVSVIDAEGKHITPGLIDCHSHTAISRGVNEGTDAVTVEVRIGDVIDPTDINLYRQLAGGLTTANVLHGSANPMGGQNQVIKLRWGKGAEELKFEGAMPGVKFALGENVKQANWGDSYSRRYPQTRMGVEQIMRDTFLAAREYGEKRAAAREKGNPGSVRRDLRLEAALEILNGERLIHIHSYRQDEILMFVRLAQEFDLEVGTFQHVLEGYKVVDAIAQIGAGGSTFSDWWGYKFEVYDAIPFNGVMMHQGGVLTSFNSDDSELARRMNREAAKAVKYGNISEEEALKFVTINPAKQLRIDDRIGSIEPGKDADFVIWSGRPLSSFSRAEQTWIEGECYFNIERDQEQRQWVEKERQRLIAKIYSEKHKKKKEKKESEKEDSKEEEKPELNLAERERLLSPWERYRAIDYQPLYHDGQSLHCCTGDYCDFR